LIFVLLTYYFTSYIIFRISHFILYRSYIVYIDFNIKSWQRVVAPGARGLTAILSNKPHYCHNQKLLKSAY